jgi:RNA polymerase sigma-B factor
LCRSRRFALLKAVDRYDPASGNAFSSYAVPTIAGELKRHFRDRTWVVRPPRDLQERTLRVQQTTKDLSARLDRAPTVTELAADVGCDGEQILEALQAGRGRAAISLDAPVGTGESAAVLQDALGHYDAGYEAAESPAILADLLPVLSPRSREILRFEQDLTQSEIGALIGTSQMQVSRLLRQAIEQPRTTADQRLETGDDSFALLTA